jgi:hypothetical protein
MHRNDFGLGKKPDFLTVSPETVTHPPQNLSSDILQGECGTYCHWLWKLHHTVVINCFVSFHIVLKIPEQTFLGFWRSNSLETKTHKYIAYAKISGWTLFFF